MFIVAWIGFRNVRQLARNRLRLRNLLVITARTTGGHRLSSILNRREIDAKKNKKYCQKSCIESKMNGTRYLRQSLTVCVDILRDPGDEYNLAELLSLLAFKELSHSRDGYWSRFKWRISVDACADTTKCERLALVVHGQIEDLVVGRSQESLAVLRLK